MVETGKPGTKYIRFLIEIWYQESDQSIHIVGPVKPEDDGTFHCDVNNFPGSVRYHRNLYKHFRKLLEKYNKWSKNAE